MPLSADPAAVEQKRRLHWRRNSQHACRSSTQVCSAKSAYRKCSTRLAYAKKKRASVLRSYQYGSITSQSRVSARVNKTWCLPSCHSLLLQGASSEPTVKGHGTTAGSGCSIALNFDTTDRRNTLKQTPASLSQRWGCVSCAVMLCPLWSTVLFSVWSCTPFSVWLCDAFGHVFLHSDGISANLFPQSFRYNRDSFLQ